MHPVRKKGRGGGGGKAVAPHPDELIGVSPPSEDAQKRLPGLRTRKTETTKSPVEGSSFGSSNLAVAVLSRFQREKESLRGSGKVDDSMRGSSRVDESMRTVNKVDVGVEETTPKVVEGGEGEKPLPEAPQKKPVRSVSRGNESASKLSCGKEDRQVQRSGDERKNPRRSVSAQPIRECRHREPFDCSSKSGPSLGVRETQRGVARAFLRSSTKAAAESRKPEVVITKKATQQEETVSPEELKRNRGAVKPNGQASSTSELHQRLASLEERVRQLESELKGTKELLHASNPLSSQVLSEIQLKIANLEKAVVSRVSCDAAIKESRMSLASLDNIDTGKRTILSSYLSDKTAALKEKPSLQQKLVESRAALEQKIVENKVLLRSKIAALDGGGNEGDVIASEFLASLTQSQMLANGGSSEVQMSSFIPSKFMDVPSPVKKCSPVVSAPTSAKKRRTCDSDADNGMRLSSGSYKSATSASEIVLETTESLLQCDETLEDEAKENAEPENSAGYDLPLEEAESELCDIGTQAAMAGWYAYEAEGLVLAHEDGSCAFYDVANMDLKSLYKSPAGLAPATWRDCWLIRAAASDGRLTKYVVAASAGTAVDPAFCSWNFYDKTIAAYHCESLSWPTTPTSSSPGSTLKSELDFPLWWYRPCGSIIASGGSGLKTIALYDIRDGEMIMNWNSNRCLATIPYSSPIQWRSRDVVLLAEEEGISLWDISADAQCVNNVDLTGKTIRALHIYNSDGECNGGVRQRISNSDTGGVDGVFATEEAVNILDVRTPSGIGLKLPTFGHSVHSLYASGDAVYAGMTGVNKQCMIQQWSIRKGQSEVLYTVPYSASSHYLQTEISQVWGNSEYVMAVNGNGLFVFDASASLASCPRGVIGSDDLYCPSFDYSGSKLLLVSRDRPASWKYWPASTAWTV